ncbi:MAG TPA: DUF1036 domain-containing protein [Alphaproteobacteria bacterium]|nr:DUF1036 domain-containing protein [Alphaproteobacteria bacterium]
MFKRCSAGPAGFYGMFVAGGMAVLAAALTPLPARAAMQFCNRTPHAIEAALGFREGDAWSSQGWWRLDPGQCAIVFGQPLTRRYYFDYALALAPPKKGQPAYTWEGKYMFCIDTKPFRIKGDTDCEARGYQTEGFQQIDVGEGTHDYRLSFRDK